MKNEEVILANYGFALTNYNGIEVYSNNKLTKHFFSEAGQKSKIVIHHTAGGFEGDLITLLSSTVSVAFLISPQGKIVMLHHPKFWAWHLGRGALGGNEVQSRISIGIELSNWGFLVLKGDILFNYLGRPYCRISDTHLYEESKPWKRFGNVNVRYFSKYTENQYISLKLIKDKLCELYGIPNVRYTKGYSNEVIGFSGITTHTDFRLDKYDLSPIFDWSKIMSIQTQTQV